MSEQSCPLCGQDLGACQSISICNPCHTSLTGSVRATGEFSVPDLAAALSTGGAEPVALSTTDSCNWCGKSARDVRRMLSSAQARICNECVSLCALALESEFGPGWSD